MNLGLRPIVNTTFWWACPRELLTSPTFRAYTSPTHSRAARKIINIKSNFRLCMPVRSPKHNTRRSHLAIVRPGFESILKDELKERFNLAATLECRAAVAVLETLKLPPINQTVFVRQYLHRALRFVSSDNEPSLVFLTERIDVMVGRSNWQSGNWTIHSFAVDDDAGLARARDFSKKLMSYIREKHPNLFKRYISKDEFADTTRDPQDFALQIYCPAADDLWFSISRISDGISPHEAGFKPMRTIQGAPSRSASKLEEALAFMGRHPKPGQTAVDLGAAPGGWSLVLARHGADVKAIDHGELKLDPKIKLKGSIEHIKANGLKYMPEEAVDWLVCDMVMGAKETLDVLNKWIAAKAMRQFVVNIKLPKNVAWSDCAGAIELSRIIDLYDMSVRHLLHDRSEITIMGFYIF